MASSNRATAVECSDLGPAQKPPTGSLKSIASGSAAIPRIVLFDDDPIFARAMERTARRRSVPLVSICNPTDAAKIAGMPIDVAIVDFDLGDMTGVELADWVTDFVGSIPILLISYTLREPTAEEPWPRSIKRFALKADGVESILIDAIATHNRI
jgi:CheY-like chemotaxis protein